MSVHNIDMNIVSPCLSNEIISSPNLLKSADKIDGETFDCSTHYDLVIVLIFLCQKIFNF